MKKLNRLLFSAAFLASLLVFNACEKDDPEPDGQKPTIDVGADIIGMTDET